MKDKGQVNLALQIKDEIEGNINEKDGNVADGVWRLAHYPVP